MEPPKLRGHQWLLFFPYLAISFSSQIFVSFLSEYIYSIEAGCEAVTPGCTGVSGGRIFFFPPACEGITLQWYLPQGRCGRHLQKVIPNICFSPWFIEVQS